MIAKNFKYRGLIELFEAVSAIPRPTFSEGKIADYICDFARERGFFFLKDEYNNVLCDIYSGENIIQFCTREVEV